MNTPHRSPTTLAAAIILLGLAMAYGFDAVRSIAQSGADASDRVAAFGIPLENAGMVMTVLAVIVLVMSLFYVRLAVGVFRRQATLREAGLFITAFLGVLSALFAGMGLASDPVAPNAAGAVATAVANLAVAALLWHPRTRDDVDRAERARLRSAVANDPAGSTWVQRRTRTP